MMLLKVYRYVKQEDGRKERQLYDAIAFRTDMGYLCALGPDEEFEVEIEELS